MHNNTSSGDANLVPAEQTLDVAMTMLEQLPPGVGIGVGVEGVGFGVGTEDHTQTVSSRSPSFVSGPQVASYPEPTIIMDVFAYAALNQVGIVSQMTGRHDDTSLLVANLDPKEHPPVVLM